MDIIVANVLPAIDFPNIEKFPVRKIIRTYFLKLTVKKIVHMDHLMANNANTLRKIIITGRMPNKINNTFEFRTHRNRKFTFIFLTIPINSLNINISNVQSTVKRMMI